MSKPRDFNHFFGEALDRNRRAGEAVRKMQQKRPFANRDEIKAAFDRELECLEAGAIGPRDELALRKLGISL